MMIDDNHMLNAELSHVYFHHEILNVEGIFLYSFWNKTW